MTEENLSVVAQTTICDVEAPRLCRIDTASIRKFLRERDEYEQVMAERNENSTTKPPVVSLKSTISEVVLNTLCEARMVSATTREQLTDEMLKETLVDRTVVNFVSLRVDEMESMVQNVKMDMSIKDCKIRIWQLVIDYENALCAEGYQGVIEKCPQTAIKHIRDRTRPLVLQERMVQVLQSAKKEGCHYNHFYDFVQRLVQEAETVEKEGHTEMVSVENIGQESKPPVESEKETSAENVGNSLKPQDGATLPVPCEIAVDGVSKVKTPFCWNKAKCFGQRHRLKHCPNSTSKEKESCFKRAMRRKYGRKSKKLKDNKGMINNVRILNIDQHSILFKVSFADAIKDAVTAKVHLAEALAGKGFHQTTIQAAEVKDTDMRDD